MPLRRYGVLCGQAIDRRTEVGLDSPHYQVRVSADGVDYRVAVNVLSQLSPSELLYVAIDHFRHPITAVLLELPEAFTSIPSVPGGLGLDFIRGNLFSRLDMVPLPPGLPGPDNDLNDRIDHYVGRAIRDPAARLYVFGERWGPEEGRSDKIFGFRPGNGVHDVHMNQGNVGRFVADDGVWQDGGMMFHFPSTDQWVAIFLAFQSQAWHTDDTTGHRLDEQVPQPGPAPAPSPSEPDLRVHIIAALVNPVGPAPEAETVTLLNTSPHPIELGGWALADQAKRRHVFGPGTLEPGVTLVVPLMNTVQLGNRGGIITLLDDRGLKVHGVAYTKEQAWLEGATVTF